MTDPPEPSSPLGDLVAAHLVRVEITMLSRILTTTLAAALPAAMVRVERQRTIADRLTARQGRAVGVSIEADGRTLTFRAPAVGAVEATVGHTVHGVVLSRTRVTTAEWLDELAAVLNKITADDQAARVALERALLG